jgi:transcriptional regulator with XRE-family HTH domain
VIFAYHSDMQLKEWRKKRKLSQQELAKKLEDFARLRGGESPDVRKLRQTTLGYWERGTLPRKEWLIIIDAFTNGQVNARDFVNADGA